MTKAGYDSWFFVTADYVFGRDLERITSAFVKANGGNVLGSVRAPLNTADFSSFLLQAQASRAKVVGLANAGADTINAIKQAAEFGIRKSNQKLVALLLFISDVNSLGLETAQGLLLTSAFYWDMNDETRAWSRRYFERMKKMPDAMMRAQAPGRAEFRPRGHDDEQRRLSAALGLSPENVGLSVGPSFTFEQKDK
jgi:branched-chain amino acid transport system substrate-binding protein